MLKILIKKIPITFRAEVLFVSLPEFIVQNIWIFNNIRKYLNKLTNLNTSYIKYSYFCAVNCNPVKE